MRSSGRNEPSTGGSWCATRRRSSKPSSRKTAQCGARSSSRPASGWIKRFREWRTTPTRQTVPKEHDAVFITAPGGPDVLERHRTAVPMPGDDEVLIRVRAAASIVMTATSVAVGRPRPTATFPVSRWPAPSSPPGAPYRGSCRRAGLRADRRRRLSAYAIAKAAQALPVPAGLAWPEAAALPEAAFTVWHNFFRVAQLGPAESVLLHGGTSGVGTLAIQVLSALGHPVFATCGSADKVDAARRLGARDAFGYRQDDYVAGVRAATGGRGVDVIVDMSGARHSVRDVEALARRGRLVHLRRVTGQSSGRRCGPSSPRSCVSPARCCARCPTTRRR